MRGPAHTVNGLALPVSLVALLEEGRWRLPADLERLRAMTGLSDAADLLFCDLASMQRNTAQLVMELEQRDPVLFGLASSSRSGAPISDRSLLDVDRCVLIACTNGDGIVCLDYREQPDPAVVVSDWDGGGGRAVVWRTIAPNVSRFAAWLEL